MKLKMLYVITYSRVTVLGNYSHFADEWEWKEDANKGTRSEVLCTPFPGV
jgi:hypothetical protein